MRGIIWAGLLLLITSGCLAFAATSDDTVPELVITPELAHNFTLETLTGETISLSDWQGQWVVVNFWATWCKPCVKEMPYLQKLADEGNIVVLGVNFNETAGTAAQFVAENNISFPILLNPNDITLLVYQVRGLPRTFVIAPDGTIALRIIGAVDEEQFDLWLEEHLTEEVFSRSMSGLEAIPFN